MNIESQNAALMPLAHQATPQPTAAAGPRAEARPPEPADQSAVVKMENQKRIAIIEKIVGMNKSLIIEKDAHRVGFIYKTVDTKTGEVVRVWPQKEVASALMALADSDARAMMAGMMIDGHF
jgi:uncharacterized FlaG/YvyC family protein